MMELRSLLALALDVGEWSGSRPGRFTSGERTGSLASNKALGGPWETDWMFWERDKSQSNPVQSNR